MKMPVLPPCPSHRPKDHEMLDLVKRARKNQNDWIKIEDLSKQAQRQQPKSVAMSEPKAERADENDVYISPDDVFDEVFALRPIQKEDLDKVPSSFEVNPIFEEDPAGRITNPAKA